MSHEDTCRNLMSLLDELEARRLPVMESIGLLLNMEKDYLYGRVATSKLLGLTERTTRTLVSKLKTVGARQVLTKLEFKRFELGDKLVLAVSGLDAQILEMVPKRVVEYRDFLVISLGEHDSLYLIGFAENGSVSFPGAPEDFVPHISNELIAGLGEKALITVWSKYTPLKVEAAIITALAKMCYKYSGTKTSTSP